jgi:glutathione S-transferase
MPEQQEPRLVLHQFPSSHFNEKARWALDWKELPHQRKHYLPGPHASAIKKLSGQSSTPVLEIDRQIVSGSAAIIAALEQSFPNAPSLYPDDAGQLQEALAIQTRFDDRVGPAVRASLFAVMLPNSGYMARTFSGPQPLPMRLIYRAVMPFAKKKVSRAYRTDDRNYVDDCLQQVDEALDFVAETVSSEGFLVGSRFSVADLTCAALLAPLANPDHEAMRRPEPIPAAIQQHLARYASHPGIEWVHRCYRGHRPQSKAFD